MKYDAFISYRHSDLDLYIAKKMHKALETFRVPRSVAAASGKKNIRRVFRDQEELPIGSDLGDNIEAALAESEFLIVICSPRTPESYWVQKEISTFIGMHGREHVLAVLIEGEPDQAFPKQLLEDEEGNPVEPLAADVRGTTRREIDKKLRTEIMRLAAPLLHCSYDDLRQRHRERKMRRIASACGAAAAVALLFGAYSTYNAAMIRQNYEGKQRNQSKYLADTALQLLEEGDRRTAVLVALEALPSRENNRPYVAEAEYALSRALRCYDTGNRIGMDRVLQHDQPVSDFWLNAEGTIAVSVDQGEQVYVWKVENAQKLLQLPPRLWEDGRAIGILRIMACKDSVVICYEDMIRSVSFEGEEKWSSVFPERIHGCEMNEGSLLAACIYFNSVDFYDLETGKTAARMPEKESVNYSMESAFSEDGTRFAVAHFNSQKESDEGCISVYDFPTKTVTECPTAASRILDLHFTSDGQVAAAEYSKADLKRTGGGAVTGYLEKIDPKTCRSIWRQEYPLQMLDTQGGKLCIRSRKYQDAESKEVHDEVLLAVNNHAYAWDNKTGRLISEIVTDSSIVSLRAAMTSGYGYLAQSSGAIDIVDMTMGLRFSSSAIRTDKALRDVSIRGGALVMRAYASPELTVMNYRESTGMEKPEALEETVSGVDYSMDESIYAVRLYSDGAGNGVRFYRTEDDSFLSELTFDQYIVTAAFADDSCYAAFLPDGEIVFYDTRSGQKESLLTGEWTGPVKGSINAEHTFALQYGGDRYCVTDLQKRTVVYEGNMQQHLFGAVLSNDGKRIYGVLYEAKVGLIDAETGRAKPVELAGYQTAAAGDAGDCLAVSGDGGLLAVSCSDGFLRVLDTKQMETVAEVPFFGMNRRFMAFVQEDTCVMLQGNDYYLRVYDLKQQKFTYIAPEQYYEIDKMVMDSGTDTISLVSASDLVILNGSDYERIAQIDGGRAYFPKNKKILLSEFGQLYRFPYMDLEMLRREAGVQFGEERLSEQEKTKYHVE